MLSTYKNIPLIPIIDRPKKEDYTLDMYGLVHEELPDTYEIANPYPIYNQGRTSMCMAYTIKLIKQLQEWRQSGEKLDLSEGYTYAHKFMKGKEGMSPLFAFIRLRNEGICESELFNAHGKVDEVTEAYKRLSSLAKKDIDRNANKHTIKSYMKLQDREDVMRYLVNYGACMIGIDVFDSFYKPVNGFVKKPSGRLRGGHAMTIVGIMTKGDKYYYKVQNSWGNNWGDAGFCYIDVDSSIIKTIYGLVDDMPSNREITLEVGSNIIRTKHEDIVMDTNAVINDDDRMMVPVRFIAEALGKTVEWMPPVKGKHQGKVKIY